MSVDESGHQRPTATFDVHDGPLVGARDKGSQVIDISDVTNAISLDQQRRRLARHVSSAVNQAHV
jgi:hypothetical protein